MASRTRHAVKVVDGDRVDTSDGFYLIPDTWHVGGDIAVSEDLEHHVVRGTCADYPLASIEITGRTIRFSDFGTRQIRVRATIAAIEGLERTELKGWLCF